MVRGCQREMIMLQVEESDVFESAWLVLRRERERVSEGDMLAEANRIIGYGVRETGKPRRRGRPWLSFLLGACCGASIFAWIAFFLIG